MRLRIILNPILRIFGGVVLAVPVSLSFGDAGTAVFGDPLSLANQFKNKNGSLIVEGILTQFSKDGKSVKTEYHFKTQVNQEKKEFFFECSPAVYYNEKGAVILKQVVQAFWNAESSIVRRGNLPLDAEKTDIEIDSLDDVTVFVAEGKPPVTGAKDQFNIVGLSFFSDFLYVADIGVEELIVGKVQDLVNYENANFHVDSEEMTIEFWNECDHNRVSFRKRKNLGTVWFSPSKVFEEMNLCVDRPTVTKEVLFNYGSEGFLGILPIRIVRNVYSDAVLESKQETVIKKVTFSGDSKRLFDPKAISQSWDVVLE